MWDSHTDSEAPQPPLGVTVYDSNHVSRQRVPTFDPPPRKITIAPASRLPVWGFGVTVQLSPACQSPVTVKFPEPFLRLLAALLPTHVVSLISNIHFSVFHQYTTLLVGRHEEHPACKN